MVRPLGAGEFGLGLFILEVALLILLGRDMTFDYKNT